MSACKTLIAAILAFFVMSEAMAKGPVCAPYPVLKNRINQSGESLRWRGISQDGQHVAEVFTDERDGSEKGFTVIVRRAIDSRACVVFSGFWWMDAQGDTPWRVPRGGES